MNKFIVVHESTGYHTTEFKEAHSLISIEYISRIEPSGKNTLITMNTGKTFFVKEGYMSLFKMLSDNRIMRGME